MLSVLVQSRKSSFQHCATVSQLLEGDMSPRNASFTGAEMQPVLNHSHFLICIFGDTTDSCQISLFYVPFYHLFNFPFYHPLKFSNTPYMTASATRIHCTDGHQNASVPNTLHQPPPGGSVVGMNCPIYSTAASVRAREPGTPLSVLSLPSSWTVSPATQSGGPEDGIVKMTYPSGAGALYNFYSFSLTKFTSGADRSPHCTPLFSILLTSDQRKNYTSR